MVRRGWHVSGNKGGRHRRHSGGWRHSTTMNRIPALAILIIGIVLLILGISASDSIGSDISEIFSGAPSDKSIWLLVLGLLGTVTGAIGMLRTSKR